MPLRLPELHRQAMLGIAHQMQLCMTYGQGWEIATDEKDGTATNVCDQHSGSGG